MIPLFKHYIAPQATWMVDETLHSDCIGQGKKVDEFEKALEPWIGPNVTVNSGTSALTLAYDLAGIKPGDYVISTPMTCLATNLPLAHIGAQILWADVDPKTGLIDPNDVEVLLRKYPVAAIVCVDYAGTVCDLESLMGLAGHVTVIDDAAHSFGTNQGNHADFTCYSFQAIKHLTCGDGGALVVPPHLRQSAILKRWFGLDRTKGGFRCEQLLHLLGYKMHMTDIAASIGLANLPHVNDNIHKHRLHAEAYNKAGLGNMPMESSCWMYNILLKPGTRDEFIRKMAERGIQCARTHNRNDLQDIFHAKHRDLPGVDEFNERQCSIPVGWWLSDDDVKYIIASALESM